MFPKIQQIIKSFKSLTSISCLDNIKAYLKRFGCKHCKYIIFMVPYEHYNHAVNNDHLIIWKQSKLVVKSNNYKKKLIIQSS